MIYKRNLHFISKNHLCIFSDVFFLSLTQISKSLFPIFLEIAVISWILLSQFELPTTYIYKKNYWSRFSLIPHADIFTSISHYFNASQDIARHDKKKWNRFMQQVSAFSNFVKAKDHTKKKYDNNDFTEILIWRFLNRKIRYMKLSEFNSFIPNVEKWPATLKYLAVWTPQGP